VDELIVPGLSYICVPIESMLYIEGLHGESEEEEEEEELYLLDKFDLHEESG
jgi:hypothetical protein